MSIQSAVEQNHGRCQRTDRQTDRTKTELDLYQQAAYSMPATRPTNRKYYYDDRGIFFSLLYVYTGWGQLWL